MGVYGGPYGNTCKFPEENTGIEKKHSRNVQYDEMCTLADEAKNYKHFETSEKFITGAMFEPKTEQEINTEEIRDDLKEQMKDKLHNLIIKGKDFDTTSGITDDTYTIQSGFSCSLNDISSLTTATESNKKEICIFSENGFDVDDIKLAEGLLEMEMLDQKLAMKQADEHTVKEKRLNFKKLFKSELEQLNLSGRKESQEERENTFKYLALEGAVQENIWEGICNKEEKNLTVERGKLEKHKEQHLETNFIKRNVEVVRDACGFFSLTMQENQRLDQLLQDWTAEDCSESEAILQLSVSLEEGFVHMQEEQNTLESIEDKLKCLRQNDHEKTEEKFNSAQDRLQEQDVHHRINSINVELEKLNGNSKKKLCNFELGDLVRKCSQELEHLSIKPHLSYDQLVDLLNAMK